MNKLRLHYAKSLALASSSVQCSHRAVTHPYVLRVKKMCLVAFGVLRAKAFAPARGISSTASKDSVKDVLAAAWDLSLSSPSARLFSVCLTGVSCLMNTLIPCHIHSKTHSRYSGCLWTVYIRCLFFFYFCCFI